MEAERPLTRNIRADREPLDLEAYEKTGGYQALRKALGSSPEEVTRAVKESGLQGRGGAGFPTGSKWAFVPSGPAARHPTYLVCNADEMEPGTFKDRLLLEGDPHQLLEGMILAAFAIRADEAFLFLRWEYRLAARTMEKAIAEARGKGYLGSDILGSGYSLKLHLHVSVGRYMCGEETGLLNSLEGKRASPRSKPPFPAVVGLWGMPTVVNNVETLCNVPHIVNRGPDWFKSLSRGKDPGTKLYGASGRVKRPGIWELPMGTPIREILEEHAGGMLEGFHARAVIPGGASTEFLPAERFDVPMDFGSVQAAGSRLGTGTMIVLDDRTCPVGMLRNLEGFFARESCGWCTPCRDGLPWVEKLLDAIEEGRGERDDLGLLMMHARYLGPGLTYCALAPGAVEPLKSGLELFEDDFLRHIDGRRCPWR